jgi:hypothetical protein|tara:strand:+ start:26 stop:505 length:480 start_codon:yes stop_codon:yes gene_type:complete
MTNNLERQIINLVATDRLYKPSSSFDGKLERSRPKIGRSIYESLSRNKFQGERAYVRVEKDNERKAKDIRAGIQEFAEEFPQYGTILNGMIEKQRVKKETHLYFGMQDGRRLTNDDYLSVLEDMGLGPVTAQKYSDVALDISRNLSKKREETERSVLIG